MIESKAFGGHLAALRHKAGISQSECAAALGLSNKTVSKWETGNGLPTLDALSALAQLYGTSMQAIMAGYEQQESGLFTIALTGGPCSGKSMALPFLRKMLRRRGIAVFCLDETASLLRGRNINEHTCSDRLAFQRQIFQTQLQGEQQLIDIARQQANECAATELQNIAQAVVLCDRGLCDGLAYLDATGRKRILSEAGTTLEELYARYDAVLYLESAMKNGSESLLGTNGLRTETKSEALALSDATKEIWLGHPNLTSIASADTFAQKLRQIEAAISLLLGFPPTNESATPQRVLVRRPDFDAFIKRSNAQVEEETLTFAHPDNEKARCLLIARKHGAVTEHAYIDITDMNAIDFTGEVSIDANAYRKLKRFADEKRAEIHRKVCWFVYEGQLLNLAFFDFLPYVAILEGTPLAGSMGINIAPYLTEVRDITSSETFTLDRFALALAQGKL